MTKPLTPAEPVKIEMLTLSSVTGVRVICGAMVSMLFLTILSNDRAMMTTATKVRTTRTMALMSKIFFNFFMVGK